MSEVCSPVAAVSRHRESPTGGSPTVLVVTLVTEQKYSAQFDRSFHEHERAMVEIQRQKKLSPTLLLAALMK